MTTDQGISISKAKKIFIENTVPVVDLGADKLVCSNATIMLDAGIDSARYQWTPSHLLSSDSVRKPMATVKESTLFKLIVTQCAVTVEDSIWVNVAQVSKPAITRDDDRLRSSPALSYQWYRNGKKLNGATNRTIKPETAGYFTVLVKNQLGCESLSDPFFFLPKGKRHHWFHGIHVKCTPNPGNGQFQLLLSALPEKPIQMKVYDRFGQVIYKTRVTNFITPVDISKYAKGVYMVELRLEEERFTLPVIIQ